MHICTLVSLTHPNIFQVLIYALRHISLTMRSGSATILFIVILSILPQKKFMKYFKFRKHESKLKY
jgi:hypothetical protein